MLGAAIHHTQIQITFIIHGTALQYAVRKLMPFLAKLAFSLLTGKDGRQTGKLGQNDAEAQSVNDDAAGTEVAAECHATAIEVDAKATATEHAVRAF